MSTNPNSTPGLYSGPGALQADPSNIVAKTTPLEAFYASGQQAFNRTLFSAGYDWTALHNPINGLNNQPDVSKITGAELKQKYPGVDFGIDEKMTLTPDAEDYIVRQRLFERHQDRIVQGAQGQTGAGVATFLGNLSGTAADPAFLPLLFLGPEALGLKAGAIGEGLTARAAALEGAGFAESFGNIGRIAAYENLGAAGEATNAALHTDVLTRGAYGAAEGAGIAAIQHNSMKTLGPQIGMPTDQSDGLQTILMGAGLGAIIHGALTPLMAKGFNKNSSSIQNAARQAIVDTTLAESIGVKVNSAQMLALNLEHELPSLNQLDELVSAAKLNLQDIAQHPAVDLVATDEEKAILKATSLNEVKQAVEQSAEVSLRDQIDLVARKIRDGEGRLLSSNNDLADAEARLKVLEPGTEAYRTATRAVKRIKEETLPNRQQKLHDLYKELDEYKNQITQAGESLGFTGTERLTPDLAAQLGASEGELLYRVQNAMLKEIGGRVNSMKQFLTNIDPQTYAAKTDIAQNKLYQEITQKMAGDSQVNPAKFLEDKLASIEEQLNQAKKLPTWSEDTEFGRNTLKRLEKFEEDFKLNKQRFEDFQTMATQGKLCALEGFGGG